MTYGQVIHLEIFQNDLNNLKVNQSYILSYAARTFLCLRMFGN